MLIPSLIPILTQVYEEGQGADEDLKDNLVFVLQNSPGGGIIDGTVISVSDFSQDMEVNIIVKHVAEDTFTSEENKQKNEQAAADLFFISGTVEARNNAPEDISSSGIATNNDDVAMIVESSPSKRKVAAEDIGARKSTKTSQSSNASTDVVELLD